MSKKQLGKNTSGNSYPFEELVTEDGMQWLDWKTGEPPKLDETGHLLEDFHLQCAVFREVWKKGCILTPTPRGREVQMAEAKRVREAAIKEADKGNGQRPTSLNLPPTKTRKPRAEREPKPLPEPGTETEKQEYRRLFMVEWKKDGNKSGDNVARFKDAWKKAHPRQRKAKEPQSDHAGTAAED